jgi:heme/copper-type cytochrome/quinol oxidase subunit 2
MMYSAKVISNFLSSFKIRRTLQRTKTEQFHHIVPTACIPVVIPYLVKILIATRKQVRTGMMAEVNTMLCDEGKQETYLQAYTECMQFISPLPGNLCFV